MANLIACSAPLGPIQHYKKGQEKEFGIAKLVFPAEVEIVAIDGLALTNAPSLSTGTYQLEVLAGRHEFKVIYSQMWGTDTLGSLVESRLFTFTVEVMAGSTYQFKHNGPEDIINADDEQDPDNLLIWIIEEPTGAKLQAARFEKPGILPRVLTGRSPSTGTETQIVSDSPVITKQLPEPFPNHEPKNQAVESKEVNSLTNDSKQKNAVVNNVLEKLQFWWKVANSQQRSQFHKWLITLKEVVDSKSVGTLNKNPSAELKHWWRLADTNQREQFLVWIKG